MNVMNIITTRNRVLGTMHCLLLIILVYFCTANSDVEYPTHLHYPIEGKRSLNDIQTRYARALSEEKRNKCASTSPSSFSEDFNWWYIIFQTPVYVTRLRIYSEFPKGNEKLNNLEIRIGNKQALNSFRKTRNFLESSLCKVIEGNINSKIIDVNCTYPLVGEVLIIEMHHGCKNKQSCSVNTVLNLCEVEIYGYDMGKISEETIDNENDSMAVAQSSTSLDGLASLALVYKEEDQNSNFYGTILGSHCSMFYDYEYFHEYILPLNDVYEIVEITFTTAKKFSEHFIIEAFAEFRGIQHLVQSPNRTYGNCGFFHGLLSTRNTVKCTQNVFGNTIKLQINRKCEIDKVPRCQHGLFQDGINNCSIKVKAYPVPNIAARKNTKQNSTTYGGVPSLANDQQISDTFYLNNLPGCTYSADNNIPWWRVDLNIEYLIVGLLIFNDVLQPDTLRNVDIRVGNDDIYEFYDKGEGARTKSPLAFEENMSCKRFFNKSLSPGGNFITCDHPLLGRYVSIQINENCNSNTTKCNANVLSLCEVEVYGFPIDRYYYGSATLGKVTRKGQFSSDNEKRYLLDFSTGKFEILEYTRLDYRFLRWWYVDLEDVHIVRFVEIVPENSRYFEVGTAAVEILVGFRNLLRKETSTVTPFHSTVVCFSQKVKNNVLISKSCDNPVVGRYVTVLNLGECVDEDFCPYEPILTIKSVQVYAEKFRKRYLDTNEKSTINWSQGVSIISDHRTLKTIQILSRETQCTHTSTTSVYPWWQMDFLYDVVVESVSIWNTNDDTNDLLHDIEIRVGPDDNSNVTEDKPFKNNNLCYKTNTALPKGKSIFDCINPLAGRYMTIQIVQNCDSPHCQWNLYNILTLCKVEVNGYYINTANTQIFNVAKFKQSTNQSSIYDNHNSDLAVDGKIP